MVVLRLARGGAKKRPFYHIVAANKRSPRDGRNIERLGYFNPTATGGESRLELNMERVDYWVSQGAQPSDRVKTLIKDMKKGPEAVAAARTKKAEKLAKKRAEAKAKKAQSESSEEAQASEAQTSEEG